MIKPQNNPKSFRNCPPKQVISSTNCTTESMLLLLYYQARILRVNLKAI